MAGKPNYVCHGNDGHSSKESLSRLSSESPDVAAENSEETDSDASPWYAASKRPEWWLVFVGLATLVVILIQTLATKDAAKAALLNSQAAINAERPWFVPMLDDNGSTFAVGIYNRGRTPATVLSGSASHISVDEIENLPIPPVYDSPFILPELTFIVGGDSFPILPRSDPESIIDSSNEKILYRRSERFLIFYGRVIYRDVLQAADHETRWCFAYNPWLKKLVRVGPKEYNDYT